MIADPEIEKEVRDLYKIDEFVKKSTSVASIVEAQGYISWPRLKDTIEYAKGMGFKKLGLAFCVGLRKEAEKTGEILNKYDFEVCSVCCKTEAIKKTEVDVPKEFTMISKTGYPIGGTPPFGYEATFLIDTKVMEKDIVYVGGGAPNALVKISPKEIQRVNNGVVTGVRK